MGLKTRLANAWNILTEADKKQVSNVMPEQSYGPSYGIRPTSRTRRGSNEHTIISAIYTRLAMDVASVNIQHVKRDEANRYVQTLKTTLNTCLTEAANLDQPGSAFRQDIAMTLFEKGVLAIVPVLTSKDPDKTGTYEILALRVAQIVNWYPRHVRVSVYDEDTARMREIVLSKEFVAIVENPLYSVMNDGNSTLQRIIRKLNLLDAVDEATSSGKLDLMIQLPYTIRSESRREQADRRRNDIETQLTGSRYGIAYVDGTEKITQLNRPAENNMLSQIQWLTEKLYSELGLSPEVFDGTADETAMSHYHTRTIEPVLRAITESMHRTFLSKTARTQGQAITFSRDPFKFVPATQLAEIGDKFTRNAILSSNEIRGVLGYSPVTNDPKADELTNKNLPDQAPPAAEVEPVIELKQLKA